MGLLARSLAISIMSALCFKPYPTDISDRQWAILEPLIPASKPGGRFRSVNMREFSILSSISPRL